MKTQNRRKSYIEARHDVGHSSCTLLVEFLRGQVCEQVSHQEMVAEACLAYLLAAEEAAFRVQMLGVLTEHQQICCWSTNVAPSQTSKKTSSIVADKAQRGTTANPRSTIH